MHERFAAGQSDMAKLVRIAQESNQVEPLSVGEIKRDASRI
jgi:hypothetical protein